MAQLLRFIRDNTNVNAIDNERDCYKTGEVDLIRADAYVFSELE